MQPLTEESGPHSAYAALYDRYASLVLSYIYRFLSCQQDAEDILTEVFLAAFKNEKLTSLISEQQIAWLKRVAYNKVVDCYRRGRRSPVLPLDEALEIEDGQLTPEEQMLLREKYERLYLALEKLPPIQQQVIRLRFGQGLRFKEIAELVNKSEATVRNMTMRTLRRLRTIYISVSSFQYPQADRHINVAPEASELKQDTRASRKNQVIRNQ